MYGCAASRPGQVPYEPHMLDAATSPLISALPQYERSFLDHLSSGQAYHGAMQASTPLLASLVAVIAVDSRLFSGCHVGSSAGRLPCAQQLVLLLLRGAGARSRCHGCE